ncbi:IS3 family transposase [Streptomyces tauricus]|uniref:IS3 family transposase n=1 Tax=Streptomyces tauricus TaxID=68274 RepID=UPI00380DAEED
MHDASGATYGARRIHRQLRREGIIAARCTIERLMREDGLEDVIRGQRRRTTIAEPSAPRPPDLVNRRFTASRPNQLWAPTSPASVPGRAGLRRPGPGRVLANDRRMTARHPHANRSPSGCAGDGAPATGNQEGLRADPSQRPRIARRIQLIVATPSERGGVQWDDRGSRCLRRHPVRGGSGPQTGQCGRRCARLAGLSHRVLFSASSGV